MHPSLQCRREFLKNSSASLAALGAAGMFRPVFGKVRAARPNIAIIMCEDISAQFFRCYGDKHANTPAIDAFAEESVVYTNAFTTVGVCAPSRASFISSMYPTAVGTQHMRGGAKFPREFTNFPAILRENGYHCSKHDKGDTQGAEISSNWDKMTKYRRGYENDPEAKWGYRDSGDKPFFYVYGPDGSHEGALYHPGGDSTPRDSLPDFLPDSDIAHRVMNKLYESLKKIDDQVKVFLETLHNDGHDDDTIVIFTSDHGSGLPRMKRWPYDSGTRVPFIVRIPEQFRRPGRDLPGTVCDDLVSFIDLGPSFLHCAGVALPEYMHGQPVFLSTIPPEREYVFTARDRIDERYDFIRSARDKRYRYIRNFNPWLPVYQYLASPDGTAMLKNMRQRHEQGILRPEAEQFFAPTKPREELYDTLNDPHEVHNLADSDEHRLVLMRMRQAVVDWMTDIRDLGFIHECDYDDLIEEHGTEWAITHHGNENPVPAWYTFVLLTEEGPDRLAEMIDGLESSDRVIRYWAAIGIGNLGAEGAGAEAKLAEKLNDTAPSVQIAAARALYVMGKHAEEALNLLNGKLTDENDRVQLFAANVLDSLGSEGRARLGPARDSNCKYTRRIYEHQGKTEFASPPFDIPPLLHSTTVSKRFGKDRTAPGKPALTRAFRKNTLWLTVNDPSIHTIDGLTIDGRIVFSRAVRGSRAVRLPRGEMGKGISVLRLHRREGVEIVKSSVFR